MTRGELLTWIEDLFAERGAAGYHDDEVTQLEHALQAAVLAEADGGAGALVAAALLHDIGHLLAPRGLDENADDRHEELGVRFLAAAFGPEVTEPVRLHVAAKRYLTATRPAYRAVLSPSSVRSLALQGGPMTPAEVRDFEANPHFQAAVRLREYDDRAKVAGLATPPFAHFRPYLEAAIRADSRDQARRV